MYTNMAAMTTGDNWKYYLQYESVAVLLDLRTCTDLRA